MKARFGNLKRQDCTRSQRTKSYKLVITKSCCRQALTCPRFKSEPIARSAHHIKYIEWAPEARFEGRNPFPYRDPNQTRRPVLNSCRIHPSFRGRIAPLPTKATKPKPESCLRRASLSKRACAVFGIPAIGFTAHVKDSGRFVAGSRVDKHASQRHKAKAKHVHSEWACHRLHSNTAPGGS